MKSYAFLFWAYIVIWVGLAGYLAFLLTRLAKIDRRLEGIERALERTRRADDRGSSRS